MLPEQNFLTNSSESLAEIRFLNGLQQLTKSDRDLAQILDRLGNPPRWKREPGFPTLLQIILEQQVSLAAAKAVYQRLCNLVQPLTPENFFALDEIQLKTIGFSRQKISYGRALSEAIVNHKINLDWLAEQEENIIRTQLKQIKGIGDWTIDNYLLMALQRSDVFPRGDLAIAIAVQKIKNLPTRPTPMQLELIAEAWRPWRAVATQILWHYYLNTK
ncbi:HhH-GPD family protein [Stanieria sp. NIES-3757]|nr:HhH-GPD family protein [Stanieria sp. NIES-3757]